MAEKRGMVQPGGFLHSCAAYELQDRAGEGEERGSDEGYVYLLLFRVYSAEKEGSGHLPRFPQCLDLAAIRRSYLGSRSSRRDAL